MTIEVALVVSIISVAFGIYSTVSSNRRSNRAGDQKDASEMTTVIVKLENINDGVSEIKQDMKSVKQDVRELNEKVVKLQSELVSIWKWIDFFKKNQGINSDEMK